MLYSVTDKTNMTTQKKKVFEAERKGGLFDCHNFSIVAWSELKLSNEGGPCTDTEPFF